MNCTFCVVPAVRGRARSRPFDEIVDQVERLASRGTREILLLGQAVNAYGMKEAAKGKGFADLLRRLDSVEGLRRIRFASPHPVFLSDEVLGAIADCGKVCEHIHLPVQSGSDDVLERMRRGYGSGSYRGLLKKARAAVPGIAITTDVIVGFPGETDGDFRATLDMVREEGFDGAFTFKYSPRPGTPAATMPAQVAEGEKEERLAILNHLLVEQARARGAASVGLKAEAMIERACEEGWQGRLRSNRVVRISGRGRGLKPGDLATAVVERAGDSSLYARLCAGAAAAC